MFSLTYTTKELRLVATSGFGTSVARFELPEGLVRIGRINNPETFAQLVRQAMLSAKPHAIRDNQVMIGLPEEQAFVKLLQLPPNLTKRELRSSIEYQWKDVLPVAPDQVFYDCAYIKSNKHADHPKSAGSLRTVLLVAYPRDIISTLLAVLHQIGLIPELFLPESFGLARLYSRSDGHPVILLDSLDGQAISASIVKDNLTLFSTTLHTSVDDLRVAKQVVNLREFYLRTTDGLIDQIKDIRILPHTYAGNLQQTLLAASIDCTIADHPKALRRLDPSDSAGLASLVGINQGHFALSILPPELMLEREARQQRATFRSISVILLTILSLMTYFSIIFLISLRANDRSRAISPPNISQPSEDETTALREQVAQLNVQIMQLTYNKTKSTNASELIGTLYAKSNDTAVTIKKLTQTSPTTLLLDVHATSQREINAFVTQLKAEVSVADVAVTSDPAGTSAVLTLTRKGAP